MKDKKSSVHDDISSKFLKVIRVEMAYPLSVVNNTSLASGVVPNPLVK